MGESDYILNSAFELDRLERQAALQGHDRVRDHVDVRAGQTVLDAGAGSGWVSRLIAGDQPGAEVTGIDIDPEFVAFAQARARAAGLANLTYLQGDISRLPFAADAFDLVWSQYVVFFLPAPERAIAEFARVCRPGGRVTVVVTDNQLQVLWPDDLELSGAIRAVREAALHGWECRRLPAMLRAAGLEDVTVQIATDRVYTFVGPPGADRRRNIEESFGVAIRAMPEIVGGAAAAEALVARLMAFVDRDDTCAFSTHWLVSGTKPGPGGDRERPEDPW